MGIKDVGFDPIQDAYKITHAHGEDRATVLVNTTGTVNRNLNSPEQPPLVRSLVSHGLLRQDGTKERKVRLGAAVEMNSHKSAHAQNIYVLNMMLWAPGFFTSSAYMMALAVDRTLKQLFE